MRTAIDAYFRSDVWNDITGKKVYLYGFNEKTKRLLMGLIEYNIYITGYVVNEKEFEKNGIVYLNKPVISVENFHCEQEYIILSGSSEDTGFEPCVRYMKELNELADTCSVDMELFSSNGNRKLIFRQRVLNYLIYHVVGKSKRLLLYGTTDEICRAEKKLRMLDIFVYRGISCNMKDVAVGASLLTPYDILYEDTSDFVIWVLDGSERHARNFIRESGIDENIFYTSSGGPYKIFREICFDPNLGYNTSFHKKKSVIDLRGGHASYGEKRIGIVGGSTSDVTLYNERSWPECLQAYADDFGLSMTIFSGSASGYASSQELVKFVRDMAHLKLDVLISYSRINELGGCAKENFFVHPYQEKLFRLLAKHHADSYDGSHMSNDLCMGVGTKSHAEHWLLQERMLFAICKEFGIRFYAILPPYLHEKKIWSPYERNLLECLGNWSDLQKYKVMMQSIRDLAKTATYSWMVDFTEIFDQCEEDVYFDGFHVIESGNQIIAKKVLDLLKDEVFGE